jgi:hypothetical protein
MGEPTNVQLVTYVTERERAEIAAAADAEDRKVAAWVRLAIRERLEKGGKS